MLEIDTRQQLIDRALALAGWNVADAGQVRCNYQIEVPGSGGSGVLYADYVLLQHGKVVAVVEAKRTSTDAAVGREQALQYAQCIQAQQGGEIPFVLYTNGHDIHFWEHGFYPPGLVHGFPTRDDLDWLLERRANRQQLAFELVNTDIVDRSYQVQAIRKVLEGMEARRRKFLLVQATGTGKTRVAVALVDVLRRARWAKRVLFLVDRIALKGQALDAFKEHIPDEARWPNQEDGEFTTTARIFVDTYPAMLNRIQASTSFANYLSPHLFDLVIADESHRSIYNVYQQVLDYFCAVRIGLTATPTAFIDHDTFTLFDCPPATPTFSFSYEEAIGHAPPYLCPFDVIQLRTRFQVSGIHGGTLDQDSRTQLAALGVDPDDVNFDGSELERTVTNSGTNSLIVREFMESSIKDGTGTLPGKTIVFAMGKAHARRLEAVFDDLYPEHAGTLARVLVSDDPRVHGKGGLLDQFKTRDMPRVAISVDMLDTGVDVPEVVNLLFAKPVYSYTKFWQMIGRGTRVLPAPGKQHKWCTKKEKFLIVDCWDSFQRFKIDPQGRIPVPVVPLPVMLFVARLDLLEAALATGDGAALAAVATDIEADLAQLPANNVVVRENREMLDRCSVAGFWAGLGAEDIGRLRTQVAPVLRARSAADDKRLRFERDVTVATTLIVAGQQDTAAFVQVAAEIVAQIDELPLGVNTVHAEAKLINDVRDPVWWSNAGRPQVSGIAERLGPLMKFRQPRGGVGPIAQLHLRDQRLVKEIIEFGPQHERLSTAAYRERLEAYVKQLVADNAVLQRIQAGEPVSDIDVRLLANLLADHDPFVTEDLLRKVYDHKSARLLQFMRHILGLERLPSWSESVHSAFEAFMVQHPWSAAQLQFLRTLCAFVVDNGSVERKHLVEAPFTLIHPQGIRGVFANDELDEVLAFTAKIAA